MTVWIVMAGDADGYDVIRRVYDTREAASAFNKKLRRRKGHRWSGVYSWEVKEAGNE